MTLQEIRDENKDSEGDPHMKSARRSRAMAISQGSMMKDVATADVIIVNPTHYAVALKWSRAPGSAPTCVAKGVDNMWRLNGRVRLVLRRHAWRKGLIILRCKSVRKLANIMYLSTPTRLVRVRSTRWLRLARLFSLSILQRSPQPYILPIN